MKLVYNQHNYPLFTLHTQIHIFFIFMITTNMMVLFLLEVINSKKKKGPAPPTSPPKYLLPNVIHKEVSIGKEDYKRRNNLYFIYIFINRVISFVEGNFVFIAQNLYSRLFVQIWISEKNILLLF